MTGNLDHTHTQTQSLSTNKKSFLTTKSSLSETLRIDQMLTLDAWSKVSLQRLLNQVLHHNCHSLHICNKQKIMKMLPDFLHCYPQLNDKGELEM